MKELVFKSPTNVGITTSLLIAEVFEKRHDNILRDIQNLECSKEFRLLNFEESKYINGQGREKPMYEITKDGFSFLAFGYKGEKAAQFKEKFIAEFNRLAEAAKTNSLDFGDPNTVLQLAQNWKVERDKREEAEREIILLEEKIKEQQPKIDYVDKVLDSKDLIAITIIAKDLGTTAKKLNLFLQQKNILQKEKVNGCYVLASPYETKGYAYTNTHWYGKKRRPHLYWTEKGRLFIIQLYSQLTIY